MNARAQDLRDEIEEDDEETSAAAIEEEDDDFELEIVDDVAEDEKPRMDKPVEPEEPDEEELESYSDKVQARIKKLTFEAKEAARQRAHVERQQNELLQHAQRIQQENQRLQQQLNSGRGAYLDQAKQRLEAQMDKAKRAYKEAYEAGDSEAVVDAQTELSRIQAEQYQLQTYLSRQQQQQQPQPQREQAQQPAPQQQPQRQPQRAPELTDRQKRWLSNNDWYGNNQRMTAYALGVHEELVREGVDPESDTYYKNIDAAMRERFADVFTDTGEEVSTPRRKASNVVAPAARTSKAPRKIKLTATQASIAKRLGLTPKQYAEQLLKEQQDG